MQSWIVDTNVLIDIFLADARFGPQSRAVLDRLVEANLVINPVIYAELAAWIDSKEQLDSLLPRDIFRHEAIPMEAAYLAGRAFRQYREQGGTRKRMVADFLIGAHAAVQGHGLISRDRGFARFFRIHLLDPTQDFQTP